MLTPTHTEIIAITPELILTLTAGLALVVEAFLPGLRRSLSGLTLLATMRALVWLLTHSIYRVRCGQEC